MSNQKTRDERMVPPRLSLMPQRAVINDNQPRAGAEEPAARTAGRLSAPMPSLPMSEHRQRLRILEALLFAAAEPLDEKRLAGALQGRR